MAYPTYLDLKAYLKSNGIEVCGDVSVLAYKRAIEMAIINWERDTGWYPFNATTSETRTIDGPEGSLIFPQFGIITVTALTIGGVALTVNEEYWLQHQLPNGPYMAIELAGYATGERRSVAITGTFGYAATTPTGAIEAILAHAAHALYPALTGLEGDIAKEKQGPVEFEYQKPANGEYVGKRGQMLKTYEDAVKVYRRPQF